MVDASLQIHAAGRNIKTNCTLSLRRDPKVVQKIKKLKGKFLWEKLEKFNKEF